jgi:hypothetical protein
MASLVSFTGRTLDHLPGGFRLEYCGLFGEGIDAFVRVRRKLLDDTKFPESRDYERARFLEFSIRP